MSNFSGYSAISVLDRANLDKLFDETLSGYYEDDAQGVIRLGHMTHTDYIMTGNITRTSTGYAMQIQIGSSADGTTRASYSGTCTIEELDNFVGINRATADLLGKMGVELTERSRAELAGAAQASQVSAHTALARSVTAQRGGSVVAAMSFLTEAASFNQGLSEANERLSELTARVGAGGIGETVRNEIQLRNMWKDILDEAEEFYGMHPPLNVVVRTAPELSGFERGRGIDFGTNQARLSFQYWVEPNSGAVVLRNLFASLKATGRMEAWGLVGLIYVIMS